MRANIHIGYASIPKGERNTEDKTDLNPEAVLLINYNLYNMYNVYNVYNMLGEGPRIIELYDDGIFFASSATSAKCSAE